jgi:Raf kinase inhibitor-like YbhB/YbcL family protein
MKGDVGMELNLKDLAITSLAFGQLEPIPTEHTGEGTNISPELRWSGAPEGTRQLALICHDPDAPLPHGVTHWVVYRIPADATGIEQGGGASFVQGVSDMSDAGYSGPMPPEGHGQHHYYFWLYALDTELDAQPGFTRSQLLDQISDHVIEQARLVGTYQR